MELNQKMLRTRVYIRLGEGETQKQRTNTEEEGKMEKRGFMGEKSLKKKEAGLRKKSFVSAVTQLNEYV